MKCLLLFLIFGYFSLTSSSSSSSELLDSEYGHVIFSSILFRHGQRTPINVYPLDPYNASIYPQGLGQLTNDGKLAMYQTGQWYREWYKELLSDDYDGNKLYMMSSDKDRTIMSAQCLLAGMLPPNGSEIWNPRLLWQPVSVHSISAQVDNIIAISRPCPKLNYLLGELNTAPWFVKYYEERKPLWKYLYEHTGNTFTVNDVAGSLMNATFILDTLMLQESYNLPLPDWFTPEIQAQIANVAQTEFSANYSSTELIRLKIGVMLGSIADDMVSKKNGDLQPDLSFKFYSGREENIFGLLIALGTFDINVNYENASVMIELRKLNDNYNVLVLLGNNNGNPTILEIPKCPSPCSLDEFVEALKEYIPTDWDEECKMSNNNSIWTYVIIVISSLVVIAVVLVALYNGKRLYNSGNRSYEKL